MVPKVPTRCQHGVEGVEGASKVSRVPRVSNGAKGADTVSTRCRECRECRECQQGVEGVEGAQRAPGARSAAWCQGYPCTSRVTRTATMVYHWRRSSSLRLICLSIQTCRIIEFNSSTTSCLLHRSRQPTISSRLLSTKDHIKYSVSTR